MNKSITQDMAYPAIFDEYAEKYGVSHAGQKYNKSRSFMEAALGRNRGFSGLPVQTAAQSSKPAYAIGAEAHP